MSDVIKYAEELTRLIIRYTRTSQITNPSNAVAPLSHEEIVYTTYHVFEALSIKGLNYKNNNDPLETADRSNNVAVIPETSVVKNNSEPYICRECGLKSQDNQSVFTNDFSLSDVSLKTIKKEQEDFFNTTIPILQSEEKFISRSNLAICVNNISRSDTFVRKEKQNISSEDQIEDNVFQDFTSDKPENLSSDSFQLSLNEIRKSAMDLVTKLNNLEHSFPQSVKLPEEITTKVQQFNGHSCPHHTSTMNKAIKIRKASSAFPKSPSTLLTPENRNISDRRRSTGGIGANTPAGKSGEFKTDYSVSNSALSGYNKTSPGSSVEFQPKFTKNPKYAHVQSTIPKLTIRTRKSCIITKP